MKMFVTGASGYIGFAITSALSAAGHHVFGLVRSKEKADMISSVEAEPVHGSMSDPSSYEEAARKCQVLIHCASEMSEQVHKLDR